MDDVAANENTDELDAALAEAVASTKSDVDHLMTFLLAGHVFYLHGSSYGILEVQHGGTMSVVSLVRVPNPERQLRYIPVEGAHGIPVFKTLSTDELSDRVPMTNRIDPDDLDSHEIVVRIPRRELDAYREQLKRGH